MKFTINLWVKIALRQILNEKKKKKKKTLSILNLLYYMFVKFTINLSKNCLTAKKNSKVKKTKKKNLKYIKLHACEIYYTFLSERNFQFLLYTAKKVVYCLFF